MVPRHERITMSDYNSWVSGHWKKRRDRSDLLEMFNILIGKSTRITLLSSVSTTRVDGPSWRVTGFHYHFLTPELTGVKILAVNSASGKMNGRIRLGLRTPGLSSQRRDCIILWWIQISIQSRQYKRVMRRVLTRFTSFAGKLSLTVALERLIGKIFTTTSAIQTLRVLVAFQLYNTSACLSADHLLIKEHLIQCRINLFWGPKHLPV